MSITVQVVLFGNAETAVEQTRRSFVNVGKPMKGHVTLHIDTGQSSDVVVRMRDEQLKTLHRQIEYYLRERGLLET